MATEGAALTSGEYIKHHLQNLTFGQFPDGSWGIAHSAAEAKSMGFWALHLDTLGWSFFLGSSLFIYLLQSIEENDCRDPKRNAKFH